MHKKFIIPAATAFVAGLAIVPTADTNALEGCTNVQDFDEFAGCITNANAEGGTITLGKDINLEKAQKIEATAPITINLNGHTIDGTNVPAGPTSPLDLDKLSRSFNISGGTVTFTGTGTLKNTSDQVQSANIYIYGNGKNTHVIFDTNVTLEGSNPIAINTYTDYANDAVQLDVKGTILNNASSGNYIPSGININGNYQNNAIINISGNVTSTLGAAVYQAGVATTTLTGSLTGTSGIVMKSGTLNVNGGNIHATGTYIADPTTQNNGLNETTGAAIQVESQQAYTGNVNININDGSTLSSDNGNVIQEYGDKTSQKLEAINLNGDVTLTAGPDRQVLDVQDSVGDAADSYKVTIDGEETTDDGTSAKDQLTGTTGTFTTIVTPDPTPDPNPNGSGNTGNGSTDPSDPGNNGGNPGDNGNTGTNPGDNNSNNNGGDNNGAANGNNGNNGATGNGSTNAGGSANNGANHSGSGYTDTSDDAVENPDTADPVALYATVATLSLLGLSLTSLIAQRQSRR